MKQNPKYMEALMPTSQVPWESESDEFERFARQCQEHEDREFGRLAMLSDAFDHDLEALGVC